MTGVQPEKVPAKPTMDKILPIAVDPKKMPKLDVVVTVTEDGEDRPWRSGDPVPITGTASFGATTATITVSIPQEAGRTTFNLYATQNGGTPSTTTSSIAFSSTQPAGNSMGCSNWTYAPAIPGPPAIPCKDLTIQVTFMRSGNPNTLTVSHTIPGASIASGASVPFVLA